MYLLSVTRHCLSLLKSSVSFLLRLLLSFFSFPELCAAALQSSMREQPLLLMQMAILCWICYNFSAKELKGVLRHMNAVHSHDPSFRVVLELIHVPGFINSSLLGNTFGVTIEMNYKSKAMIDVKKNLLRTITNQTIIVILK